MSGSVAEERIRAKAEAAFRQRFPDARIVHELVLDQGGVRIDLAAVGTHWLAVGEIKSERDVLKRLSAQLQTACLVADEVWLFVAPKHQAGLDASRHASVSVTLPEPRRLRGGITVYSEAAPNPSYIAELRRCHIRSEGEGVDFRPLASFGHSPRSQPLPSAAAQLQMLWRSELASLARPYGAGPRATRDDMVRMLREAMSGSEVRRGVCAALRRRPFPRADEARP